MMASVYTKIKSVEIDDIESLDNHNRSPSAGQVTKLRSKRRSCLRKCLCITFVVIGLLLAILIAMCVASYVWVSSQVHRWTIPISPTHGLPLVRVTDTELTIFKDQAKSFVDLLQAGVVVPEDLIVTERNLNGLAWASDFVSNAIAHLKTNQVTIDMSLPMDKFPGGKGRYFVGKGTFVWVPETSEIHTKLVLETSIQEEVFYNATFHLSSEGDMWNLMLLSAYFAPMDWSAPKDFLDEHRNLLDDVYSCDDDRKECQQARNILNGIHKVILQEKQIVFRAALEEDTSPQRHRFLAGAAKTASYEPGLRVQLARYLVGF